MTYSKKIPFYIFIPLIIFLFLLLYGLFIENSTKSMNLSNGCSENNGAWIKYRLKNTNHKITFCKKGNKDTIKVKSNYIDIPKYIYFDYIGNPNDSDVSIYIEDKYNHKYIIPNLRMRAGRWTKKILKIPSEFKDQIRLVAADNSIINHGWIGIGNVTSKNSLIIEIYLKTILYIYLFSFLISTVFGYFLKRRNILKAFIYMSLFLGIYSLLIFNTYLFSSYLGKGLSFILFLLTAFSLFKLNLERFFISIKLFVFLSTMMTIIIFLAYGNLDNVLNLEKASFNTEYLLNFQEISATMWHQLPIDNWISKLFANALVEGHLPQPTLVGSWLSSDRPPVQTGFFLLFSIFSSTDLAYLVISVGMQLLVIIFIILFLMHYIKEKNYIFFISILIFFNGFVFVHSLFVWPKLLSALFQGISFYYLYNIWFFLDKSQKSYILFGISSSLAFLSHGGSIFYLLSLSIVILFTLKNKKDIVRILYGLISAIMVYLPWLLYQKLLDPPGDRLLKWHLANKITVTDKTFFEVLYNYYNQLSLSTWLDIQFSHMTKIYYSIYFDFSDILTMSYSEIRHNIFYYTDYSFLFFSSFFLILFYFLRSNKNTSIKYLTWFFAGTYILYSMIWSLLLASDTIIHQGAYFAWFCGFISVTLVIYSIHRYIFYILGSINLIVFYILYILPYFIHSDIISGSIVILMVLNFFFFLKTFITMK